LCSQAALFATTTVIARALGEHDLGSYALGFAVLSVLNLLALGGFQSALTRFVAMHRADASPARLRGAIRLGLGISVGLSVMLAIALAALAGPIAAGFNHSGLAGDLRLVALALPACTIRDASLAATQGWRSQRAYATVFLVVEPIVRLALTVAAIAAGFGVTGCFAALAIGAWLAALLGSRALRAKLRSVSRVAPVHEVRAVLRYSSAAWGTALASVGLIWADTLILGALTNPSEVGIYNVSTRLVNLAVFVMVPVNAAFSPQFAHLLHVRDHGPLRRTYAAATTWITRLSLPAFVVLIVFPSNLLHIFGAGFVVGATVTVILSLGQLINAMTGPAGALLNMSGHVSLSMANNIATLVLNVALNLWLIPRMGITGAALAWSISLAAVNLARLIEVHLFIGGWPFGRGTVKALVSAAGGALAALGVRIVVAPVFPQLVIGAAAVAVVYLGLVLILGLETDDRALISGMVRRSHPRHSAAARVGA
jgi:O-antigen/teichoic acid export membrane protein